MYYAENLHRKAANRIISALLVCAMVVCFMIPKDALAARSDAGGAELSDYDWGDFGMQVGMFGATYVAGAAVGGLTNYATTSTSFVDSMGGSFGNLTNLGNLASGYNSYLIATQISRGVGYTGAYYDWDKSSTFVVSSVASGLVIGALNPSIAAGSTTAGVLEGAGIGAIAGAASAGTMYAIDRDKIDDGEQVGAAAQVAGMFAGTLAGSIARRAFEPQPDQAIVQDEAAAREERAYEVDTEATKKFPELTEADRLKIKSAQVSQESQKATGTDAYAMQKTARDQMAKAIETESPVSETNKTDYGRLRGQAQELRTQAAKIRTADTMMQGAKQLEQQAAQLEAGAEGVSPHRAVVNMKTAEAYRTDANKLRTDAAKISPATAQYGRFRVMEMGKNGMLQPGRAYNPDDFSGRQLNPIAKGTRAQFAVDEPLTAGAYFRGITLGAVRDTFSGPNLASMVSRVASIMTWEGFRKDDKFMEKYYYMEPLIKGVVGAVAQPLAGGLINIYGLSPSLYIGTAEEQYISGRQYELQKQYLTDFGRHSDIAAFGAYVGKGIAAGVFESGVTGGLESAFEKWSTRWDPVHKESIQIWDDVRASATALGLNMLAATTRGIAQGLLWNSTTAASAGKWDQEYNIALKPGSEAEHLVVSSEQPGLLAHIGASVGQALTETFYKGLSMGRPFIHGEGEQYTSFGVTPTRENISILSFNDYVNNVKYLAGTVYSQGGHDFKGGHAAVLAYQFGKTSLSSAGSGISGALAQVNFVTGNIFQLQPERLVLIDVVRGKGGQTETQRFQTMPYAIQHVSPTGDFSLWMPFPNINYSIMPQTSFEEQLKRKGKSN